MSRNLHSVQTVGMAKWLSRAATAPKQEHRQERRVTAILPVRVSGTDDAGNTFQELAYTLEITRFGARLAGMRHQLKPQDVVTVKYRQRRIEFQVVWTKPLKGTSECQVGLRNVSLGESWELESQGSTRSNVFP